jgi:hypothetical protein
LDFDAGGRALTARINDSGAWYFASFAYSGDAVTEAWFDEAGAALAVWYCAEAADFYDGQPAETRFFDNMGHISRVERAVRAPADDEAALPSQGQNQGTNQESAEIFEAVYSEKGAVSWKRGDETYRLQWDERGFLVRLNGGGRDIRYEYTLDRRGNWITRREISMKDAPGALVPASVLITNRIIRY